MGEATLLPEPVRIISDLHLGHPGSRIAAVEELRPLFEGAATVIFNGDTREMRALPFLEKAGEQTEELLALLRELGIKAFFIRGNHDNTISDLHHLDLFGTDLLVTHGDVLFPEVSPWGVSSRQRRNEILALDRKVREEEGDDFEARLRRVVKVCEFSEVFERKVSRGALGHFYTVHHTVWPPRKFIVLMRVWARQKRLASRFCMQYRPQARMMIFGHTHFPGVWGKGGRIFINTGGFISFGGARIVEIAGEELKVFSVRKEGGRFVPAAEPRARFRMGRPAS